MLKPISNSNNIEVAWFRTYKNAKKKEIIMFVARFNNFHVMDPTIICIICYSSLLTKGAEAKSRSLLSQKKKKNQGHYIVYYTALT